MIARAGVKQHTNSDIPAKTLAADQAATLTEQAYRLLEEQIVTLRLKPGDFVSEHEVADDLGFGRTPIREALQRLAFEGLVTVLPRKGILVSRSDTQNQLRVLEVRRELERLLARLGAERASEAQRQRFVDIADGMERAASTNDDIAFMRLDREHNLLVADAAHNEYASRAMRYLHGHSRRFWYLHYQRLVDLPLCAHLHAVQAREIAQGHVEGAGTTSDRLMDYIGTFVRATLVEAAE
ncbi:GntR family transcriptional regulator [Leptospira interrogans]